MYLRPRQIFQTFVVEEKLLRLSPEGRQVVEFVASGAEIQGVVSTIEPFQREKFKAIKNEIKYGIVQHLGTPRAKVGDRLVCGDKKYYVETIDNPAGVGQFYVYWCSERFDL